MSAAYAGELVLKAREVTEGPLWQTVLLREDESMVADIIKRNNNWCRFKYTEEKRGIYTIFQYV